MTATNAMRGSFAALADAAPGVGAMLRGYRIRAGLSMLQLSLLADCSYTALSRIEGGSRNVRPPLVHRVADALGLHSGERAALLAASVGLTKDDVVRAFVSWPDAA